MNNAFLGKFISSQLKNMVPHKIALLTIYLKWAFYKLIRILIHFKNLPSLIIATSIQITDRNFRNYFIAYRLSEILFREIIFDNDEQYPTFNTWYSSFSTCLFCNSHIKSCCKAHRTPFNEISDSLTVSVMCNIQCSNSHQKVSCREADLLGQSQKITPEMAH